ncbi:MAG: YaaR family protein [Spirochaetia bacterium]|nr:YaaR family protein [Spirochaetia bacterium]
MIRTDKTQTRKKEKLKTGGTRDKNKLFADQINEAIEVSKSPELFDFDFFMDNLEDIENKFIENPDSANFFEYKTYLKTVAGKIIQNAYKKISLKDSKKKQYEIVKVIDKNLDELYQLIMQKSANKQKISIIMGNIKGLILDLSV